MGHYMQRSRSFAGKERKRAVRKRKMGRDEEGRARHGASLLIEAVENEAIRRRHNAADLAFSLGVHASHWYRLRAEPSLLARCGRDTHRSIAAYVNWPLGRVLLASGVIEQIDFEVVQFGGESVVSDTIRQLEESAYGAGLVTSLFHAPRDHQILMAELFSELRAERVRTQKS